MEMGKMNEKRFTRVEFSNGMWGVKDNNTEYEYPSPIDLLNLLNEQQTTIQSLKEDNDKLRELIKQNVFGMYEEGSLTDLKFKAIAYDDIVKLEISKESEPKVIVSCKQGKKENVQSFCQMFIPFEISYEIKEVSGMSEKEVCDECANISLKRMYLILLKAQELVLDINPQYKKKEILNYLVSIEHEILMLNDKGNCLDRDLFE